MKTIKTTIILILITFSVNAQYYEYSFNAELDHNTNKRIEFRGMYENWYIGLYGENVRQEQNMFGYGFNLGLFNRYRNYTFLYGVKLGILDGGSNKPLYGLNAEVDYSTSDVFFIGLKAEYSIYHNGLQNNEVLTVNIPSVSVKFGIKF